MRLNAQEWRTAIIKIIMMTLIVVNAYKVCIICQALLYTVCISSLIWSYPLRRAGEHIPLGSHMTHLRLRE